MEIIFKMVSSASPSLETEGSTLTLVSLSISPMEVSEHGVEAVRQQLQVKLLNVCYI